MAVLRMVLLYAEVLFLLKNTVVGKTKFLREIEA
jgi:hypothetical protein